MWFLSPTVTTNNHAGASFCSSPTFLVWNPECMSPWEIHLARACLTMKEFRMGRAWRENMNHTVVQWEHPPDAHLWMPHRFLAYLILFICCSVAALAQTADQPTKLTAPFTAHVTHLLGFAGAKNNASGTLSIQDSALQFQQDGKPTAEVKIASVQDVFLGEQSKQVGGLPMTLG